MNEIEILESTYFDIATIKRKEKSKDPNTGVTTFGDIVVYKAINCAISKKDRQLGITNELLNLNYTHMMFANPTVIIKAGDSIEVTFENGMKDLFIANKPFYYKSHLEVELTLKERA